MFTIPDFSFAATARRRDNSGMFVWLSHESCFSALAAGATLVLAYEHPAAGALLGDLAIMKNLRSTLQINPAFMAGVGLSVRTTAPLSCVPSPGLPFPKGVLQWNQ